MKMQNTEMEFVAFDAQDVIATSGGFSLNPTSTYKLKGFSDGIQYNAYIEETLSDNQTTYTWDFFKNGTSAHSDYPKSLSSSTRFVINNGANSLTVSNLYGLDTNDRSLAQYDKVYKWITDHFENIPQ